MPGLDLIAIAIISASSGTAYGWFLIRSSKEIETNGPGRMFFLFGSGNVLQVLLSAMSNAVLMSALLLAPTFVVFKLLGFIPMKGLEVLLWVFALLAGSAIGKAIRAYRWNRRRDSYVA
jgi:hypothetical protein